MTLYAGFDTAQYPGKAAMAKLKAGTNLTWVEYYLWPAPAVAPAAKTWRGKRAELVAMGWKVVPVFVGRQVTGGGAKISANLAEAARQGAVDGAATIQRLHEEGFPEGTWPYFDTENGSPVPARQQKYLAAWANVVNASHYNAAIYNSKLNVAAIRKVMPKARQIVFAPPTVARTNWSGATFPLVDPTHYGANVVGVQHRQNVKMTAAGVTWVIDMDTSTISNPGI